MLDVPRLDALPMGAHRLLMLTDESLSSACGVRVAFSDKEGGMAQADFERLLVASPGDPISHSGNPIWREVKAALGLEAAEVVVCRQVHGTHIVALDTKRQIAQAQIEVLAGADGLVVGCDDVLAILHSADCLLLVAVSPSGRFVVAHAGWRGAVGHIASKAICALAANDPHPTSQFNVYLGPYICPNCFEVGSEVIERFREEFDGAAIRDERHVDLAEAVSQDAVSAGVSRERITSCGICTVCDSHSYYSYRATGGRCGRNAVYVARRA